MRSPVEGAVALRPRQLIARTAENNPLPEGTIPVGAGLVFAGATAYAFLILTGRVLGPERFTPFSVLWSVMFVAAPGFFFPIEQEVGRALSERRARGVGGGPLVRRALLAAAGMAAIVVLATLTVGRSLTDSLFDENGVLVAAFLIGVVGYAFELTARGTLSGNGRFGPYGVLLGTEGIFRLLAAMVLAVMGVKTVGAYGLLIGLAPIVSILVALPRQRGLVTPGPDAPWSELSAALGFLLVGSFLMQLLVNAGPIAVKLLATETQDELAGRFLAGLILTRVPLFLFQAVQAALLPKLAGLAAAGKRADFRMGLRRLLIVVIGIGVLATVGAFLVGPPLLKLLFSSEFDLGRRDLTMLAAASAGFMLAQALSQALIALEGHARAALGWFVAITTFVVVTALGEDLLLRVELGLVVGSVAGVLAMAALLLTRLHSPEPDPSLGELVDAIRPDHEIIEP